MPNQAPHLVPVYRRRCRSPKSDDALRAALNAVNGGMSLRKAADMYGFTKSTLQRIKVKQYENNLVFNEMAPQSDDYMYH